MYFYLNNLHNRLFITILGFLIINCAHASSTTILEEILADVLVQIVSKQSIPGATAAFVLNDGRAFSTAAGYADLEFNRPMLTSTRMPAGSVGKTFVAAMTLSLASEGRLDLEDKISKWLGQEDWYPQLENRELITVKQLLNHSSGLPDHVFTEQYGEMASEWMKRTPAIQLPPRELVKLILDLPVLFAPGEGYAYSDTGYILLGLVLESVLGTDYDEEVIRTLIYPLNLRYTVPEEGLFHPNIAQGYIRGKLIGNIIPGLPQTTLDKGVFRWNPIIEWTGGGFVSNSEDLAHWAKALYEGRALPQGYTAKMIDEKNPYSKFNNAYSEFSSQASDLGIDKDSFHYGLGVMSFAGKYGEIWGHTGLYPGYHTAMIYYPDYGIAFAIQINTDADSINSLETVYKLSEQVLDACVNLNHVCPRRDTRAINVNK